MVKVRHSLEYFSLFSNDETITDERDPFSSFLSDLKQMKLQGRELNTKPKACNERITQFLEKFDRRKHNQLVELSAIEPSTC